MNRIQHLAAQARRLFAGESKLSRDERATQQWQLLTSLGPDTLSVNIIIGKGGVNTAFLIIGNRERVVCYPDELLETLSRMASAPAALWVVAGPDGVVSEHLSEKEALLTPVRKGHSIVALSSDGRRSTRYTFGTSLVGRAWVPKT